MEIKVESVLISDEIDPLCVNILRDHGIRVACKKGLTKDELIEELKSHEGLIVRSDTKVTEDVINNAPSLKVIGRAGTGVDNIDIEAATRKGIVVLNTPGGNSISACELTCALISSLARNVTRACQSLKEGRWDRKLYKGNELYGKTLAVLGLGRIGREVATRMASYGMRTIGYDPVVSVEEAKAFGVEKMELDDIWPIADYITVHTPLIPQTRNLINDATLTKSKRGVCVINVARGGIVDEAALLKALQDGRCGGAALDVYEEEPPKNEVTLSLIKHPQVVATPHLGASTKEAQQRVAVEIAEQFVALSGRNNPADKFIVSGAVNAPMLSASLVKSNVPWINLAKDLGGLLGRFLKRVESGTTVGLTAIGEELANKKFLTIPLLYGLLSSQIKNLSMVSAPARAEEAGLAVDFRTKPGEPSLEVTIGSYTVLGTALAQASSRVLSINESPFSTRGIEIDSNSNLYEMVGDQLDMTKITLDAKEKHQEYPEDLQRVCATISSTVARPTQKPEKMPLDITNLL